jgi:hypothetical protein
VREKGDKRDPRVGLIHELTHAYVRNKGAFYEYNISGVSSDEVRAENFENTERNSIREVQLKNGETPVGNEQRKTYDGIPIVGLTPDPQLP